MDNENKSLIRNLLSLAHLDIDAIHAYRQAIKEIDVTEIRENLTQFQQDHEVHVRDISRLLTEQGAEPPVFKP